MSEVSRAHRDGKEKNRRIKARHKRIPLRCHHAEAIEILIAAWGRMESGPFDIRNSVVLGSQVNWYSEKGLYRVLKVRADLPLTG